MREKEYFIIKEFLVMDQFTKAAQAVTAGPYPIFAFSSQVRSVFRALRKETTTTTVRVHEAFS